MISFVFWVITRRNLNRRFGSTYWFRLQGSSCPRSRFLEMRLVGCPETSVLNHLMPRNNPEDGRIQIPTFSKIVLPSSGSSTILRNVCIHIPERTASLPRRLVSSTVIILIVTVITISKRNVSECRIYHLELVYDG